MRKPRQVNIHEAKTHLSRLVEQVAAGEGDVVIAKAGKPIAVLTRLLPARPARTPGFLKGQLDVPTDFDAPLPEHVLDSFEGGS